MANIGIVGRRSSEGSGDGRVHAGWGDVAQSAPQRAIRRPSLVSMPCKREPLIVGMLRRRTLRLHQVDKRGLRRIQEGPRRRDGGFAVAGDAVKTVDGTLWPDRRAATMSGKQRNRQMFRRDIEIPESETSCSIGRDRLVIL